MRHLKISAVFVDLFAILVCFLYVQWYFAVLLTNPSQEQKPTSKPRAEIIVADSWKDISQDVDIWIRRVDNEIVGYKNREQGPFKLHGDHTSSTYGMIDGQVLKEAIEVITITKKIAGKYQVSLHGFRLGVHKGSEYSEEVIVEVENVEPYRRICKLKRTVSDGEEVPVCEFEIDNEGNVISIETDPDLLSKFLHLTLSEEG